VYATYLEECRDEWLEAVLGPGDALWEYVLARVAIDFRRELVQADDTVVVSCALVRLGTSSLTTREQIHTESGALAAEAEAVLVARDSASGRSRQLRDDERSAFERALPAA
jgi:acyl-CoA thioesterase FadM